jgi:hypothetical protein
LAEVVFVHTHVGVQQRPGQLVAVQVPPQVNVPPMHVAAEVVKVHAPVVVLQHGPVQGDGLQTVPAPWKVVPAAQPVFGIGRTMQAQVVLLQHTPGQAVALQEKLPARVVFAPQGGGTVVHSPVKLLQQATSVGQHAVPQDHESVDPTQLVWVVFVQVPVRMLQHLPRHGVGVQVAWQKNALSAPRQAPAVDGLQAQLEMMQHTPVHGDTVHVVLQKNVFGRAHVASVAFAVHRQVVALQQAPVQGLVGVHELVRPWNISPPAHPDTPTELHAQLVMLQHTPVHGAAHVPLQVNTLGAAQISGAVTVHAPVTLLQHLPMQGVGVHDVAPQ